MSMERHIAKKMRRASSNKRYEELSESLNVSQKRMDSLKESILLKSVKRERATRLKELLQKWQQGGYDEKLWNAMIEKMMVYKDRLVFTLKDGTVREVAR